MAPGEIQVKIIIEGKYTIIIEIINSLCRIYYSNGAMPKSIEYFILVGPEGEDRNLGAVGKGESL